MPPPSSCGDGIQAWPNYAVGSDATRLAVRARNDALTPNVTLQGSGTRGPGGLRQSATTEFGLNDANKAVAHPANAGHFRLTMRRPWQGLGRAAPGPPRPNGPAWGAARALPPRAPPGPMRRSWRFHGRGPRG